MHGFTGVKKLRDLKEKRERSWKEFFYSGETVEKERAVLPRKVKKSNSKSFPEGQVSPAQRTGILRGDLEFLWIISTPPGPPQLLRQGWSYFCFFT